MFRAIKRWLAEGRGASIAAVGLPFHLIGITALAVCKGLYGWGVALKNELLGPSGYKIVGVIVAVYVFFYQERVQSYQRDLQRADEAYNSFFALAANNDPAPFIIAMRFSFQRVQLMDVLEEPSFIWWWWNGNQTTQPYMGALHDWLETKLETCQAETCGSKNRARVDLRKADLDHTYMGRVNLSGADLTGASLKRASLNSVDFTSAVLTGVDLSFSKLTGAKFIDANLDCADLSWADAAGYDTSLSVTGSSLRNTNWEHAKLTEAAIYNADFGTTSCDRFWYQTSFKDAFLTYATIFETTFAGANLTRADFSNADFRNVCIEGAITDGTIWPEGMVRADDGTVSTPHRRYLRRVEPEPKNFPCR
jgi:uncharacterized protein YjbI with pentapeptide repeats